MTDTLISQLLDFGALGIFAGFLIWQHLGMQKRLDGLVEKFQGQLREIDDGFEARVETMRARYDVVYERLMAQCKDEKAVLAADRDSLRNELSETVKDSDRKLTTALEKMDEVIAIARACDRE